MSKFKLIVFILIAFYSKANAQCGLADVTITDYCNNQFAEFTINDPDVNNRYQWFTDATGTTSIGYGPGANGKYIYSPSTYATGSGPQDFWYQKQVTGVTGGPQSGTFAGSTSGNGGGRTNVITVDSDFDFTLNSITVPFHFWGAPPAGSYGVKITMDGTTSNWYYFTPADLVAGGANLWFLNIPLDINGLGQGIPVTAGAAISIQGFAESDGTEAPGTSFMEFAVITAGGINNTYNIGSPGSLLTIHQDANDRNAWPTGRDGFFDWDITMKCPLQKVTANEEADLSKCCVPVTDEPVITTSTGMNIFEIPVSGSLTAENTNGGHYFKWYKDGAVFQEGVGLTTVNISDLGKYSVSVSEKAIDVNKQSCISTSKLVKIRSKKLFIAPVDTTFLCLGESVALSSQGGLSGWKWTTTGGGNVDNSTIAATNWTPNAEGVFKVAIEAMVPEGELIVNGDFEAGATGFDVSSKMREAPWGDVAIANVPGCGTGPNLVFRNYGISGNGNGVYTVGTSAPLQDVWCFNGGVTDHTTGTGNFFMMDGLTGAGWQDLALADNYIWQQKVVVEKNVDYEFGAWFASLDNGGPGAPIIKFFVNGKEITLTDPLNYSENWDQTLGTWNSGNYEGEITLQILNAKNVDGGNDFAMDDITFSSGNALQSDTTIVVVEICVDPCVKPTSVAIADDSLKICDQVNYTHTAIVVEDPTPLTGYFYSWYKDGVEIIAPTSTVTIENSGIGNFPTSAGWYKIRVEDGDNGVEECYLEDSIYLEVKEIPTTDLGDDIVACEGPIELDAGASMAGLTYLWSTGETTQTINVNDQGVNEYSVIVSNWQCEGYDTIRVTIDDELQVQFGPDSTVCIYDLPVDISAGDGFASYKWLDDADVEIGINQIYNALSAGEYRVEVTDADGCVGYDTIHVFTKPKPDAIINNGTDTIFLCPTSPPVDLISGQAGATYAWTPTGATTKGISDNTQGWYSVEVTVNGCVDEDSIYILISNQLTVDIGDDQLLCPGVEATFYTTFPEYNHTWNNGVSVLDTFKTTVAGMITVEVTDVGGCTGRDTAYLEVDNPLTIDLGDDREICVGDPVEVFGMVSNRVDLNSTVWNDNSTGLTLTTDVDGTYYLDVDSAGCLASDTVKLTVNALPIVFAGRDTFICMGAGEVIPLDAGVGFDSYEWSKAGSGNTQQIVATDSGEYKITVTNAEGCMNHDSLFIDQKQATVFQLFNGLEDTTICPLSSAVIDLPIEIANANNPVWTWTLDGINSNGNSVVVDSRADGDVVGVHLGLVNEFGCLSEDTFTVKVKNLLPMYLRDTSICVGENSTFDSKYPAIGYSFEWNANPAINTNTWSVNNAVEADEQVVSLTIVSDDGCFGDTSVSLTINSLPTPILRDTAVCIGETVVFDPKVANVQTSVWLPTNETSHTVVGDETTSFSVTVTDVNGCINTASAELVVHPLPNFTITQMPDEACIGEDIILSSGLGIGYSFNWNPNGETTGDITVTEDNDYILEVTNDATGCVDTKNRVVVFKPYPIALINPDVDTAHICADEQVTLLSNVTQYDKYWRDGATGAVLLGADITTNVSGTYILNVDNDGCSAEDTIFVDVHELPDYPLGPDSVVCFLDQPPVLIDASRIPGTYVWGDGSTGSSLLASAQGTYYVNITNDWGCEVTDEIYIDDDCPSAVYLPNAFTPNNDGINDRFVIQGHNLLSVEVMVFDRWGMLIWTGNAIGEGWDGTFQGNEVQIDVYVWKMKWSFENSDEKVIQKQRVGTVSVIK